MRYHISQIVLDALGNDYIFQEGNLTFYKKSNKWWKFNTKVAIIHPEPYNIAGFIILTNKELAKKVELELSKYKTDYYVMVSSYLF